jgi:hypothetical protein
MLWPASLDPQRPSPRGEAVATCAGRSGFPAPSTTDHEHRWWRS